MAHKTPPRGTHADTLPSGQNIGELSDLEYFQYTMWRGLYHGSRELDLNED